MPPKVTVNISSDKDSMTVGELLHAAQRKCDEPKAVPFEDTREVAEDLMVETEMTKTDIASGKEQVDEEV